MGHLIKSSKSIYTSSKERTVTDEPAVLIPFGESILSRIILSNGHAILHPTASPSEVIVWVGLQTDVSLFSADFNITAAALGPSGIRPILYVGSAEQNSASPTTTSTSEYHSSS